MRRITVSRTIEAPADDAWELLVDVRKWPSWGPSIRSARLDGGGHRIGPGTTGTVTTSVGVGVPFRVSDWHEGTSWGWDVAGLPATGHSVHAVGHHRCEVTFDVPWLAAPYVAICRVALGRIDRALTSDAGG